MKTDYVFRWRDRIARGSPWWRKSIISAVLLLAASGAAHGQNLVTNGDFGTDGSCAAGAFTESNFNTAGPLLGTWMSIDKWSIKNDATFDGDATHCYASFDVPAGDAYNRGRLIQGFNAPANTGTYSVEYDYVYVDGTYNAAGPYFWVLGVNSGDADISRFSTGGDGFPPPDIVNWDVLYQRKLAGDCNLTDCDNGPAIPVGSNGNPIQVSDTFHVPASYDYWVVVVTYGCTAGFAPFDDCTTLRGLDNVAVELVEADEEGPYTKNVAGVPNASIYNTTFEIVANVDDTNHGNSNIASAEFKINYWGGGEYQGWTDMDATDGTFDSPIEDVTYSYGGGLPVGDWEICVRGWDAGGNEGNTSCARFVTYNPADADGVSFQLSNECAIFYTLENEGAENEITTLHYGENIVFDADIRLMLDLDINGSNVNFKYSLKGNGSGYGVMSGIQYQFQLNSMLRAKTDLNDFDPSTFEFKVRARIVGQAQEVDGYGILNGAQNNAELFFTLRLHYAGGHFTHTVYDWGVECAGDPWSNLMENKDLETRQPVERGFGKETNKYGWTGSDFKDALIVGTKNAYYNILDYINPPPPINGCVATPPDPSYPDIYWRFACMEVLGYGNPDIWDTDGAEIWRFSYKNKRWQKVYDALPRVVPEGVGPEFAQGFRDSVVHNGKLYVAVDLGAFISGVSFVTANHYPGVALLVSEDGINFDLVPGCPTGNGDLCQAQTTGGIPTVNLSIRALASYGGKLYIGTLNNTGGQIWTYTEGGGFNKVWPAAPMPQFPIIGELEPFVDDQGNHVLYVGLGGQLTVDGGGPGPNNYLMYCDDCDGTDFFTVPDLPDIDPNSLFVIKLFVAQGKLFAGTVNFTNGFSFMSYDPGTNAANDDVWDVIVDGPISGGMFDPLNIYLWSGLTGDINGRIFIGTFNPATITEIPRGTAELYYSDDRGVSWTQFPMPIGWSLLGYGIRDMVGCDDNKFLCLLSATNMVAPDLVPFDNPLRAGLEVWQILNTKIASPSGETITKGKGKGKK